MCLRRTSEKFSFQTSLEDKLDNILGHEVREAEICACDRDEAEHDGRRLRDLTAVRPLHSLQLGPAGAKKREHAIAAADRSARGLLGRDAAATPAATCRRARRA